MSLFSTYIKNGIRALSDLESTPKLHYPWGAPTFSPASSGPHLLYEEHGPTDHQICNVISSSMCDTHIHLDRHTNSASSSTRMAEMCSSAHFIASYAWRKLYQWKLTWIYCTGVPLWDCGSMSTSIHDREAFIIRPPFIHLDLIWKLWKLVVNKSINCAKKNTWCTPHCC